MIRASIAWMMLAVAPVLAAQDAPPASDASAAEADYFAIDPDRIPDPNPTGRSDKLLLTGGVTQVEGAAGAGLAPWAVIGGYGTRDQIGANAFYTRLDLDDYGFESYGALIGFHDRVELSFARQRFDTRAVGEALGLGRGFTLGQDVIGVKVRLFGDLVLDQDSWRPQVAIGLQHKQAEQAAVLAAVGAQDDSGTDVYLSATKLYLAKSLLLNATLRWTEANQFGLLGFGGDLDDGHELHFEGSAAFLLSRSLAVGAEYRTRPDNLGIATEESAWDVFLAWAPAKQVSLTVAWVDLGNVVIADNQKGLYASLQVGF